MEKTKTKTKSNNVRSSSVSVFILSAAIIAFIGGFAVSGEIKDRLFHYNDRDKEIKIVESEDIDIAGGNLVGNKTLGFNENMVVTEDDDREYNVLLGTYMGVNDSYYDIQYGNTKAEIAFVKYSEFADDSQYFLIPFERKVVDIHMSTFNMNTELNTIFFLLEDGSVEYILIEDAIERNDFRSFGKIEELNNIAKFYEGTSCETDSVNCTKTAFAQSTDGRIYDLSNYIN